MEERHGEKKREKKEERERDGNKENIALRKIWNGTPQETMIHIVSCNIVDAEELRRGKSGRGFTPFLRKNEWIN